MIIFFSTCFKLIYDRLNVVSYGYLLDALLMIFYMVKTVLSNGITEGISIRLLQRMSS